MCNYLREKNHEVFILSGEYGEENVVHNISEIVTGKPVRALKYIDYKNSSFIQKHKTEITNFKITQKAIKIARPDLIYIWNMKGVSIAPVIATQNSSISKAFEIGDLWPSSYIKKGFSAFIKRKLKSLLPFTIGGKLDLNPIFAVSGWVAQEMREKYGSKEIYVYPHPTYKAKRLAQQPENNINYIFTGRVCADKGVDIAIQAMGELFSEGKIDDFTFDIYGSGDKDYLKLCNKLIKKHKAESRIKLKGRTEKLYEIYPDYNVMLMPTMFREALGKTINEAMAHALTIIASNHYGPAEILKHNETGLLFEPGNTERLKESILRIHHNKELRVKLGENALQVFFKKYEFYKVREAVEKLLIKIAKR
jgi:glycosyltransferase involved in cell wall biosynthesis